MKSQLAFALILSFSPLAAAQEILDEEQVEITTAEQGDVKRLLASLRGAEEADDAAAIAEALTPLSAYDNPEFRAVALDALGYRASAVDKQAARALAKELGLTGKKDLEALVAERESKVQVAAAYVLANFPDDKKVVSKLVRTFADDDVQDDKPLLVAATIHALGTLGHDKVAKDVWKEVAQARDKDVARAAVRYFGQIDTKDYSLLRKLCEKLEAPAPADVHGAHNPPASYWAAQWEIWSWTRRDVTWTLKQVTGQVFRPAEGEHPGDSKKALDYLKEHKRELGLK